MTLNLANISTEDLVKFSSNDLQDFQAKLNAAIEQRKEQDKIDFHNEVQELAAKRGVSLNEYLVAPPKKVKSAKYKNPANPKEVWAGRGRKPNWLLALLNAGKNLEEFKA
jgi:DNA-binding protein H-NS